MDTAVVIMSKIPWPGYSNTRLMPALTPQECVLFHRSCLQDIVQTVTTTEWPVYLYYSQPNPQDETMNEWHENSWWELDEELYSHLVMRAQCGQDLGERMYQAAQEILNERKAILFLGSDLPDLPAGVLIEAAEKLDYYDVVLGPAEDGGYYLLGMKQAYEFLFDDISWGSSMVLTETLERINRNGLSFALLLTGRDIDTWEDMLAYYLRGQENMETHNLYSYQIAKKTIEKYKHLE